MAAWRCPHCGTPQAETARCWVCRGSSTSCGSCRHFRRAVAGQLSYCGLDRRRASLRGDEHRGCWETRPTTPVPSAARPFRDRHETGELVAVASVDLGLWADREG